MKSSPLHRIGLALIAFVLASMPLIAAEIPLTNWVVPSYHRPASPSGGLSTMTDITSGSAFVGITPCRVVDTRPSQGFPAAWGPPILAANATRDFDINSAPHCTGIPAAAEAYSLNFTVTETTGGGDLRAWPTGTAPLNVSIQNWAAAGVAIANATIVPAGTGGSITVQVAGTATHLIIDINGYFTETYNDGTAFSASGNVGAFFFPGFLVAGLNANTGVFAYGVWGLSSGTGADSAGVGGWGTGSTGRVYGVYGTATNSVSDHAAGVFGTANGTLPFGSCVSCNSAGVYGRSLSGPAVLGASATPTGEEGAVTGIFTDTAGVQFANSRGALGYTSTTGVRAANNISKGGAVAFTEPHATDPSKKLTYIALEGNEAGTYFRGRGRFLNGQAVIHVPEDFKMVTLPEGLSVQVTPIGQMATVAVEDLSLDRIVVRGSRNVEFFYTVNGIRRGYGDFSPIADNDKDYIPSSPDAVLPADLRPEIRERLVANGTYKPDGTVNMETARRLGWERKWVERASQVSPSEWEAFQAQRASSAAQQRP